MACVNEALFLFNLICSRYNCLFNQIYMGLFDLTCIIYGYLNLYFMYYLNVSMLISSSFRNIKVLLQPSLDCYNKIYISIHIISFLFICTQTTLCYTIFILQSSDISFGISLMVLTIRKLTLSVIIYSVRRIQCRWSQKYTVGMYKDKEPPNRNIRSISSFSCSCTYVCFMINYCLLIAIFFFSFHCIFWKLS